MTWEIVVGIIALVTFVGTVSTWIFRLSRTLAILETTIKVLNSTLVEWKTDSEARLNDHERRISHLEH